MRSASISLNSAALTHNLNQVIETIPQQTKVLAMVKANAYGHGIENCLSGLQQADGLGVACYTEAKQIRDLGWQKQLILIEGVFSQQQWLDSIQNNCQSIIHHQQQLQWAIDHRPADNSPSKNVWLKLNTGMNRLGFEPTEIVEKAKALVEAGYSLILTSHFANADRPDHPSNASQIQVFTEALETLRQQVDPNIKASLCNSAAIINFPQCHFDWVRPGIMLYGSSPLAEVSVETLNLKPVMTFAAEVMAMHHLNPGDAVGYASIYVAKHPITKGIVSIGYGDGYPRVVDDSAWVAVKPLKGNVDAKPSSAPESVSYQCPIIGRVAMDMIAIDMTSVPNPELGYEVLLWGDPAQGAPSVDEIAKSANTIGYELLCRVTQRPTRKLI